MKEVADSYTGNTKIKKSLLNLAIKAKECPEYSYEQ